MGALAGKLADKSRVVLGRVLGAHGVRGAVRVLCLGDGPEHLLAAERVALGYALDDPGLREYGVIAGGLARPGEVRLEFEGVGDREAAAALRGRMVFADAAVLGPLPEGEHYWYELLGCEVVAGGRVRGRVREIWETGAHDVMVVEAADGSTCLVPTARELMLQIDVEERRIVVEDLQGLFEPVRPS